MDESHYLSRDPQEIICLIVNRLSESEKTTLNFAYPDLFIEQK